MLLLVAAAIAASPTASPTAPTPLQRAGASVRATASIRIVSSASISWDQPAAGLPRLRQTQLRGANGQTRPIRLIEFE